MHSFLIAIAFVAMVMTPCVVALGTSLEDASVEPGPVPFEDEVTLRVPMC